MGCQPHVVLFAVHHRTHRYDGELLFPESNHACSTRPRRDSVYNVIAERKRHTAVARTRLFTTTRSTPIALPILGPSHALGTSTSSTPWARCGILSSHGRLAAPFLNYRRHSLFRTVVKHDLLVAAALYVTPAFCLPQTPQTPTLFYNTTVVVASPCHL